MWHALIRGSVFSSIRSSSQLPSDKFSANSPPSSQNGPSDPSPSSINNSSKTDSFDTSTNHTHRCNYYDQNNNLNAVYDDYNPNNWMNKGSDASLAHTSDESLPSAQFSEKVNTYELDTSPSNSSVRTLRANRSLLDIAASRPSYNLDRSSVLIGSREQIRLDNNDATFLEDTDDDDDDTNNYDDDDDDDSTGMGDTNNGYKYDATIGTIDNNSHQWNDKKHQRQATIFTIPSRASKQLITDATTSAASTKKKYQHKLSTEPKSMIEKPKKKRRWENVSPPSSPTKKNYEMSLATIAAPPNKRKPTGTEVPRPHACPLCDRRFNRRYNLTAHIRVHDPDRKKLFDCPSCNQSFDRKHDRDRHADALHFEHKHRCYCHLCDASFTRRDALTRHVHKLHTQGQPIPTSSSPSPSTNP